MPQPQLPLINVETAPEAVRATLLAIEQKYGFMPNLYRVFASSPAALDAYLALSAAFQRGTLSATERNVVHLAASRENGCRYCVAVHSAVGDMQRDDPQLIDAIRDGRPLHDARLEALRALTAALVRGRGHAPAEIETFVQVGYRVEQVLEVLVGVTMKTLSNYTNHIAVTPLDEVFRARAWAP